ncbi:UDP-galactose transporter [Xylogone sp. PMI_703]|nr:UDP-galactose transporter [Xylogone sp. PMI_703]
MIRIPRFPLHHRLSWLHGPQGAAYAAALGLVSIQVGIGIIMKAAQRGGTYTFSPSSSVTISEFCKMLLSTLFFYRECSKRNWNDSDSGSFEETKPFSADEEEGKINGNGEASGSHQTNRYDNGAAPRLDLGRFWEYIKNEVSVDVRYGFAQLALFYALINNTNFVSYKVADPGTIQLTKSGVTFITALVMIFTLGSKITKIQWIAIVIQICGLVVTQYHPETGTSYPFSTYLILIFQVFLSALSGVYNQALLKAENASLHADNMILYASGAAINLLLHITIRLFKADEPGFFSGYGSIGAFMVIMSNVFIGLAMTAVYKYADAVIKCFATAVSTGILLYLSPILFNTELSFLVLPGTVVVFIASWLYMEGAAPKDPNPPPPRDPSAPEKRSIFAKMAAVSKLYHNAVLGSATLFTVIVVAFLTKLDSRMPDAVGHKPSAPTSSGDQPILTSPFANTLAIIRWNSNHPERMPLLAKYGPFFHDIHFSMPGYVKDKPVDYHNLTHDSSKDTFHIYVQVAKTMQLILDAPPESKTAEIDGLLFFHFDAWIDPLAFNGANMQNIWFPDVTDVAPPAGGGPRFYCTNDTKAYRWWGINDKLHHASLAASAVVDHFDLDYVVDPSKWCTGWSDIYYIPKRFFADFIFLSSIFGGFSVFHEIAVPTIVHIIDESRRRHPTRGVLDHMSDCWGSCCASHPPADELISRRCGHRLDYREDVSMLHFKRLDEEAAMLGDTIGAVNYTHLDDKKGGFSAETLNALKFDSGPAKDAADPKGDTKAIKEADRKMDDIAKQREKNLKAGTPPPGTPDGVFDKEEKEPAKMKRN